MKGVVVMGVFLGQLPPAELARLKAELAETLIAHFCYPRFYDYRTNSLRTRPIDRAKRQEVWLYLSAVDFTAWYRIDLMSTDFQHQIERLFIHFVQRNRSFFGEQGRKRMSDIRMLIGSSALTVVQGLRGHLTGHQSNPPFGSPRPVSSWSTPNSTGRPEPGWEQLAQNTLLLQQQLQEVRGEIKSTAVAVPNSNEARSATAPPVRNTPRVPAAQVSSPPHTNNGTNGIEHTAVPATPILTNRRNLQPTNVRNTPPQQASSPVSPTRNVPAAALSAPQSQVDALSVELPTAPVATVIAPVKPPTTAVSHLPIPEKVQSPVPVSASPATQQKGVPPTETMAVAHQHESAAAMVSEEDVAIFEQMRHQLVLWLRVEAVRSGIDISNQGPTQLLELLRQQEKSDETRLQIVSTMLNLCNQVMKNGKAGLYDYKQALMFHLMHTRR
ncbi:MAG TPA: hypothetical protein VGN15_11710 [Ktedonobacteraceae bacterium]|nr:hypothetical protein [Ktedonobacteraceae bacterium]